MIYIIHSTLDDVSEFSMLIFIIKSILSLYSNFEGKFAKR